ncbi:hypothetical protein ACWIUD_10470 [Helicobacter sp. 23-1044]
MRICVNFISFMSFASFAGRFLRFLCEILQKRRIYANIVILARSVTKRRISKILRNLLDLQNLARLFFVIARSRTFRATSWQSKKIKHESTTPSLRDSAMPNRSNP